MVMPLLSHTPPASCSARAGSTAIFAAVAGFVALIAPAMAEYPGGTSWDRTTRGNDFWLNYLCDLERGVAINGQPNAVGSVLAQVAMVVLGAGMLAFWWALPLLFPASPRLGRAVRAMGWTSLPGMVAVALLPSDSFASLHPYTMMLAGLPGLAAAALAVLGLASESAGTWLPAAVGGAALVVSCLDFVLYVRQLASEEPGPTALAVLERTATILVLLWMCVTACRTRGSGKFL
jgi:hypothetical protein